ncbi:MAG TPA: Gp49 family protein [Xanthobacteraceae bacterium]
MGIEDDDKAAAAKAREPRVTLNTIKAAVRATWFSTLFDMLPKPYPDLDAADAVSLKTMTVCVLLFNNGFIIIGKSAPASPANYNKELGEKFAHEDALRQAWPLFGFNLKEMQYGNASWDGEF